MLDIINRLGLFFEDCYREVSVREYSREVKISPPSASKFLKEMEKEGLLHSRLERRNLLFTTNRESLVMRDLSRLFWRYRLGELVGFLKKETAFAGVILFGSLSKLETTKNSDIDLMVFSRKDSLDLSLFEKKLGREIQVFFEKSIKDISEDLRMNVIRGYLLEGGLI